MDRIRPTTSSTFCGVRREAEAVVLRPRDLVIGLPLPSGNAGMGSLAGR
jgi:hypothetical protein